MMKLIAPIVMLVVKVMTKKIVVAAMLFWYIPIVMLNPKALRHHLVPLLALAAQAQVLVQAQVPIPVPPQH